MASHGQLPYIGRDGLIHIFTFLNVEDLFNVSSVCKDWLEVAQTPLLWRGLCLQRWGVSNIAVVDSQHARDAWKRYCLRRIHLESKMTRGSESDYTYKTLKGHTGRVVGFVYLQKNTPTTADPWSFRSTVCSASTDGTVRAWDVKDAVELWCSPVQSPLTSIVSDMEHGLVITSDSSGLIKSWQAQTGQEMASYSTASPHCTLLPYTMNNSCFLSVGTSLGTVETLTGPVWSKRSSLVVCDSFKVNLLLLSPDKKWIFAGTSKDIYDFSHDLSPKVFWAASLTNPSEEEGPLCKSLPIAGCHAAVFMPNHPARLAVVHHVGEQGYSNKALDVLDVSMKKSKSKSEIQFKNRSSTSLWMNKKVDNILLEAKDSDTLVVADNKEFQITFLKHNSYNKYYHSDISSISVDSFRMVAAAHIYLKVFTWTINKYDHEEKETAEELYQLGGGPQLFSYNRAFTHVACDYSSIVAAIGCSDGKGELKAYSFTS